MSEILAQATMPQPVEAVGGVMDHIRNSRLGNLTAKVAVVAAFVGGGELLANTSDAKANSPATVTELTSDSTVHIGKSKMSASAFSRATIMTNDRSISKVEINQLKADGQCEMFNGKKIPIYTEGHYEGGEAMGRDTRKSLFCQDDSGWYRAACGNRAEINETPPHAIENVIWAGKNFKLKIKTKASATAQAECKTADGLASAYAYGHGMGYAVEKLRFRSGSRLKAKGEASKLVIETDLRASAQAKSKAGATAIAVCIESGGVPVPPAPKDGTPGPGEGTPGQPGGPGAGGEPGNPTVGETCRNDQGDIISGPHDQFGNC